MEMEKEQQLAEVFRSVFGTLPADRAQWDVLHIDGWDSVLHMVLLSRIEQTFSLQIPPAHYLRCTSYSAICEELEGILP